MRLNPNNLVPDQQAAQELLGFAADDDIDEGVHEIATVGEFRRAVC